MIHRHITIFTIILLSVIGFIITNRAANKLTTIYQSRQSTIITDRNNQTILVRQNPLGYYAEYVNTIPDRFRELVLAQEDKYFYFHHGFNPVSILRAATNKSISLLLGENRREVQCGHACSNGSSTITQQLVKLLLSQENKRTPKNKIIELAYAISLEMNLSKKEILTMYANSLYLGNNTQGITSASILYFGKTPKELTDQELVALITIIPNPVSQNPFRDLPKSYSLSLADKVSEEALQPLNFTTSDIEEKKKNFFSRVNSPTAFEINNSINNSILPLIGKEARRGSQCGRTCSNHLTLTIDANLTQTLRSILSRHIERLSNKNVQNGAIVVIKLPDKTNLSASQSNLSTSMPELLTIIGSPDPTAEHSGYQINMATSPRPIGSTVKPFIYLKGFEKGLRPYTLVDDKEYKYTIGSGFAFYPKNYDYTYHGRVSLHYALTNSLNVPTVKVLEYVGLENFYSFLENDLGFQSIQPLASYQLGIALGGLEMNLLDLAHYMTIFPNDGSLTPLLLGVGARGEVQWGTQSDLINNNQMAKSNQNPSTSSINLSTSMLTQLVSKILSDRTTGVAQFGIKSSLNLPYKNYAVKTGTSREFHDSWTIGWTPDFVVGVWLGNSDNTAMDAVSGATGAADIWNESMNVMYQSPYNKNTPFDFSAVKEWRDGNEIQFGLADDDYEKMKYAMVDNSLILNPHDGDDFLWQAEKTVIPLRASEEVGWVVNGKEIGVGQEVSFAPDEAGVYRIEARGGGREEEVEVIIRDGGGE